jgi:hypothetical protein
MSLDASGEGDGGWSIAGLLGLLRNLKSGPPTANDPIAQYLAARARDARLPPTGGLFGSGYAAYMADNAPPMPTSGAPNALSAGDPSVWLARFTSPGRQDGEAPGAGDPAAAPPTGTGVAFGPEASGVDTNEPEIDPTQDYEVAGPAKAQPYAPALDRTIDEKVAAFNKMNQANPGDDVYLDPDWVRAMVRTESGYNPRASASDPMQVNKAGDWDDYKSDIGLSKGVPPGPDLGVRAGLDWLDSKAYHYDKRGNPTRFLGWPEATRRYNGGGNPHYLQDVQKAYQDIKAGR